VVQLSIPELVSLIVAVIATVLTLLKAISNRISGVEKALTEAIHHLNDNLARIDKRLAVNSAIIDRVICTKGEMKYGYRANRETHYGASIP
jgi:hypothetical protein